MLNGCYQSVSTVITDCKILEIVKDFIESFDVALKTFICISSYVNKILKFNTRKSLLKAGRTGSATPGKKSISDRFAHIFFWRKNIYGILNSIILTLKNQSFLFNSLFEICQTNKNWKVSNEVLN